MPCSLPCTLLKLLVRLVLGTGLFFMGWHLIFTTTTLSTDQIHLLEGTPTVAIVRTVLVDVTPAAEEAAVSTGTVERKAVAELALKLHAAGVSNAALGLAWGVALLQLIGGAMLVVGLLTRLWACLTVCMLAGLFWALSVKAAGMFAMSPFDWVGHPLDFQAMYLQGFGLLAALFLLGGGGGRLSLDQFLFGRSAVPLEEEED